MKRILAAVIAIVLLPLSASAHSQAELVAWEADWQTRAGLELTLELMIEWQQIHANHAWYFDPQPVQARAPRVVSRGSSGMGSGAVEQWRAKVALYFPADQVDRALRIMACESGGNPNAYNPSGASGLMQVLASWADNFGYVPSQLFDPDINLYIASLLWADGGWGHWVCRG